MTRKSFSRKFLICLVTAVLLALLTLGASAAGDTVYLDGTAGNDSYSGTDAGSPFKTLDKAIETVAHGGTIVLVDDYIISGDYVQPAHTGEIVITSNDGTKNYGGALKFNVSANTYHRLSGPTTFRDVTISMSHFVLFVANFNSLTFDTGLNVTNGAKWAFVVGGYHGPESADLPADLDSNITINSGTFYKVCGFSRNKGVATMTYTGTSHITVNDGTVGEIYGGSLVNHYGGSTEITVNGGTVSVINAGGDATRQLLGNAKVTINGGVAGTLNVNNVVGNADVYLIGGKLGTASITYANDNIKKSAEKALSTKTVYCDSSLFGTSQIETFKGIFDKYENLAKVYVAAGGTGDGSNSASPLGTLAAGYDALHETGGTVYVVGSVPFGDIMSYKKAEETVTFEGVDGGEIVFGAGTFAFEGNVTFKNVRISSTGALTLAAQNGELTIGEGTVTSYTGFELAGVGSESSLTVKAGSIANITVGMSGSGTHNLSVLGGAIGNVTVTQSGSVAGAEIVVSGGSINNLTVGANSVSKKLVLRLRGGNIASVTVGALTAEVLCDIESARIEKFTITSQLENGSLMYGDNSDMTLINSISQKFGEQISANLVYLADGGAGDGSSPSSALGDLSAAISALGGEDGTVVICGTYTIDSAYTVKNHTGKVTITSYDYITDYRESGAAIVMSAALTLGGETVFEKVNFKAAAATLIYAKGSPLTIEEDVNCELTNSNTSYIGLVGGHNNLLASKTVSVTVKSGDWGSLRGGYNSTKLIADGLKHNVTIRGGTFHSYVALGSRGNTSGTINADISGGTFLCGLYALYEEDSAGYSLNYNVTVSITGGDFQGIIAPAKDFDTELHGSYTLNLDGGEFMHLTDILGTEVFAGDMTSKLNIGNNINLDEEETGTTSFTNPIRYNNADPNLFYYDGFYYYTCTGSTTIGIIKAANLADIKTTTAYTILEETGGMNLWSPEIWYFTAEDVGEENAGWYMFISFDDGTTANQRMHVVKCLDGDNLLGTWGDPVTGEPNKPRKIVFPDAPSINVESLCGGMSVSRINGKTYITYIGEADRGTSNFHQTVNICDFDNPWTMKGVPTTICVPTEEWEMGGYGQDKNGNWYPKVVEGAAAVYGDNGEYYLMYTGSGYWTVYYQLSYLKFKGGDPLNSSNWEKYGKPIFARSSEVNGCGHASYITDPFGTKWAAYHGYLGPDASDRRWSHFEPMTVDANGVTIGNGSGMPNSLDTVYTVQANPMPVREKISGFDTTNAGAFMPARTYEDQFTDVTADKWFYEYVKLAYEYALANGTSATKFSPDNKFTVAQALTAAANIHTAYYGKTVRAAASGESWYTPYVEYCVENGIITSTQFGDFNKNITRGEMAQVFANILPEGEYAATRSGSNPDVTSEMACYSAVQKLYNAGIVGGDAGTGNYRPNDEIVRSEACVIFTRIAAPSKRIK
ncbi:MAG: S-layer homology domain-containing protein [Clostridia bacterium]|nr:S-layer homology domain-containing protein [Clostridia bacterium]